MNVGTAASGDLGKGLAQLPAALSFEKSIVPGAGRLVTGSDSRTCRSLTVDVTLIRAAGPQPA